MRFAHIAPGLGEDGTQPWLVLIVIAVEILAVGGGPLRDFTAKFEQQIVGGRNPVQLRPCLIELAAEHALIYERQIDEIPLVWVLVVQVADRRPVLAGLDLGTPGQPQRFGIGFFGADSGIAASLLQYETGLSAEQVVNRARHRQFRFADGEAAWYAFGARRQGSGKRTFRVLALCRIFGIQNQRCAKLQGTVILAEIRQRLRCRGGGRGRHVRNRVFDGLGGWRRLGFRNACGRWIAIAAWLGQQARAGHARCRGGFARCRAVIRIGRSGSRSRVAESGVQLRTQLFILALQLADL